MSDPTTDSLSSPRPSHRQRNGKIANSLLKRNAGMLPSTTTGQEGAIQHSSVKNFGGQQKQPLQPQPQAPVDDTKLVVEALEDDFLAGNFSQALLRANQLLQAWHIQGGVHEYSSGPRSRVESSFVIDHNYSLKRVRPRQRMSLCVHRMPNTWTDRVGAIALQSWYELWKLEQQQQQPSKENGKPPKSFPRKSTVLSEQSQAHWMPFLDTFCAIREDTASPMSTELAWIWVQLIWTLGGEWDTAFVLAMKLWHFDTGAAEEEKNDNRFHSATAERGFYFLFSQVLPRLKLTAEDEFWETWYVQEKTNDEEAGVYPWNRCKELSPWPTPHAAKALLRTLPALAKRFCVSANVADSLKGILEEYISQQPNTAAPLPGRTPSGNVPDPSGDSRYSWYPRLLWKRFQTRFVKVVRVWLFQRNNRGRSVQDGSQEQQSQEERDQRAQQRDLTIALLIMLVFAWMMRWRNRKRLLKLLKWVVRTALVLPATEIIQALLPPSNG